MALVRTSSSLYSSDGKDGFKRFLKGIAKDLVARLVPSGVAEKVAKVVKLQQHKLYKLVLGGILGKLRELFEEQFGTVDRKALRKLVEPIVECALNAAIAAVEEVLSSLL